MIRYSRASSTVFCLEVALASKQRNNHDGRDPVGTEAVRHQAMLKRLPPVLFSVCEMSSLEPAPYQVGWQRVGDLKCRDPCPVSTSRRRHLQYYSYLYLLASTPTAVWGMRAVFDEPGSERLREKCLDERTSSAESLCNGTRRTSCLFFSLLAMQEMERERERMPPSGGPKTNLSGPTNPGGINGRWPLQTCYFSVRGLLRCWHCFCSTRCAH